MSRPPLDLDPVTLAALTAAGLPDPVIADRLGCSTASVRRYRAVHAIPAAQPPAAGPQAAAARMRRYRATQARTTAYAPSWGAPWTDHDDQVLATLPLAQAAAQLGRTWAACVRRRDRLRRR